MSAQGRGPISARIMFIGEAWGNQERLEGKPFVGPAGRVLNELCLKAGINPDSCYYTNIINEQPPDNDLSAWIKRGIPNDKVVEGLESLAGEIERINPNVIVPLGNWPLWSLYGQKLNKEGKPTGILDYRGYVLEARRLASGKKIIPTVHPSYILQGGYPDAPLAIIDLKRARTESLFPEIRRRPRRAIVDPQGAEREALYHRLLNEGRWLVVDIEYIGTHLLCVGFAVSADWSVTIPIRSPIDLAWCRSLIESGRPLCAQNGMFDMGILDWHYKIDAFKHLKYDTMVGAYVLNIEFKKDLGALACLYTDLPAWWDVIDWNEVKAGRQSIESLYPYNGIDCMATYEIADKQQPELDSDPKMREALCFDMAKLEPLWRMAKRGVPIDFDKVTELRVTADIDQAEGQLALNEIAATLGMDLRGLDLNVKSPDAMPLFLFQYCGIEPGGKTDGGVTGAKKKYKTDNVTLMECMRKTPDAQARKILELVIRVREARDLKSKTLEIEWDSDGRGRCIYDCTKTGTRRLSSKTFFPTGKGSNLQNMPAPGSNRYGAALRGTFKCDPGYEFGYSDLKGAEFLVVAELTQDREMLRLADMSIKGTGNVHKETSAFIFSLIEQHRIDPSEIDKDSARYFIGKKTRHSGNYMVGWKELMGRINAEAMETGVFITAAEMKLVLEGYHKLHPGLRVWYNDIEIELRRTGMLRNLFGFPRRFNGRISQILPSAVAFIPQSTVGDCLNYGLVACDTDPHLADAGFQLLLNVHDAIGFQYPIQNRDEVLPRVNELMSIPLIIPKTGKHLRIPIEIQVGPNWGILEGWHNG